MGELKQLLIQRLESQGMEISIIPGFIRSLTNCFAHNSQVDVRQANQRLQYMGWDDFDLDYHTLQLAASCFEIEGLQKIEYRPAKWFENNFMPSQRPSEKRAA
jgi:hypothetical protein